MFPLAGAFSLHAPAGLPEPRGGCRHVEMRGGTAGNGVGHRVHHRGDRRRGAGFADALDAERVGGRRHAEKRVADRRHVGGARHGVVHERTGDELPAVVVNDLLHQRLAEALRHRAMELALDDHVVEHIAAIVDRGVGDDVHVAGGRIDLDLGDVDAVGEGQRRFGRGLGVKILRDGALLLQLRRARGKFE